MNPSRDPFLSRFGLLPGRLAYEASAVGEVLGSGVKGFEVGEAVCVIPAFSMNEYGVYATEAIVPAAAVVKRPAGLNTVEAAAVWMQYLTAWGALMDLGKVTSSDTVIIRGVEQCRCRRDSNDEYAGRRSDRNDSEER